MRLEGEGARAREFYHGPGVFVERLTIGQLAREAGVSAHTLRFYERRGLLPRPNRTSKNYRLYTRETLAMICFIKRAQDLEFSLAEVKELLDQREAALEKPCKVREMVKKKIDSLQLEIDKLKSARDALKQLDELQCEKKAKGPCAIMEALSRPETQGS